MVSDLNETVRLLAKADIRRRYPNADANVIQRRLAARSLTREELIATYGWDPTKEISLVALRFDANFRRNSLQFRAPARSTGDPLRCGGVICELSPRRTWVEKAINETA